MAKRKKKEYSGKINMTMDRGMHRALARLAKRVDMTIPDLIRQTLASLLDEEVVKWKEEGRPTFWNETKSLQQKARQALKRSAE